MNRRLPIAPCLNVNYTDLNNFLEYYFTCGFTYREIIEFLKVFHDKHIGLFTIKRKFKKWVCLECQLVLRELLAMKLKQLCSCTVRINRYGLKITGTD